MKLTPTFLLLSALIALTAPGSLTTHAGGQPLPPASPASLGVDPGPLGLIDRAVRHAIDSRLIPGAVVLIGHRGRVIYSKAFGHAERLPRKVPMRIDTLFDTASLTKVVATATSLMVLSEMGLIDLDDPVSSYLPEFAANGKERVTIRQVLVHGSGMPFSDDIRDYTNGRESALGSVYGLALRHPPEEGDFVYSGIGYIALAELVHRVSGEPLDSFANRHVFAPVGMNETSFNPGAGLRARTAPTEFRGLRWLKGRVEDPRAELLGGVAGHAGLFSTASDLALYCQMILDGGKLGGVRVLERETVAEMTTPHRLTVKRGSVRVPAWRGLGWDILSPYSHPRGSVFPPGSFGHTGFSGTSIWIDPFSQTFVIILTNRVYPRIRGSVAGLRREIATLAALAVYKRRAHGGHTGATIR